MTRSNIAIDARDRVLNDSAYNMMVSGMFESAFVESQEARKNATRSNIRLQSSRRTRSIISHIEAQNA